MNRLCHLILGLLLLLPSTMKSGVKDLVINEIMVSNIDRFVDPSWNYGGWVEFYNPGAAPCNLLGLWISDDPENLKKVHITQSTQVYGRSYKNLWFEHHDKYCPSQMNMKLNLEGGTIYLSDSRGNVILSQSYPAAVPRTSWARLSENADEWGYCDRPTPQASNENMIVCQTRLPAPEPSAESCIFSKNFSVNIPIPTGATLRYTTNGSTPTLVNGSTSTSGVFVVSNTITYRFAFFQDGFMSSPVIGRTYLKKDKDFSLPIMCVATHPDNLYSDRMGIFVQGSSGRPGRGQSGKCNWNMDWDRPVSFEFLDEEGHSLVNQEAEIAMYGGWSRSYTPHHFKIHAAKEFEGKNSLDYSFFRDKPFNRYKTIQTRNGGGSSGRILDAFLQKLALTSGLDIDAQDYQPVAHYINGVYKGVINMREPTNKHFVYANYGLDEDEIDQFEMDADSGYVQKCGTRDAFLRWYNLSKNAANESVYKQIEQLVDIDEYCNYMAVEFYLGNWDWPQNNLKGWRPVGEGGKFRYVLFDLDGAFGLSTPFSSFESKKIYTHNPLYGEAVSAWTKEIENVPIFVNMLQNARFRRHFIDAFCIVAGSVYEPQRCSKLIQEWADYVYPMQILNDNGYGRNESPMSAASSLKSNLNSRAGAMYSQLKGYAPMKLSSVKAQKLKLSSNLPQARLTLNGQTIPTGYFDGQVFAPVSLEALAPEGYQFDGWMLAGSSSSSALIPYGDSWTYYDQGSLDGRQWKILGYSPSAWKTGPAPLGYGAAAGGYKTTIDYGGDSNNKYTCYYFRRNVTLAENPTEEEYFTLDYQVDDGFVLYVNGTEAARYNMPSGNVSFSSVAETYAPTDPIEGSVQIDASLFHKGINVIAVEVHNNSTTSSDIYWNAALYRTSPDDVSAEYLGTKPVFSLPSDASIDLIAHFSKSSNSGSLCPVVINEVSAANSVFQNDYYKKADWIELYNQTSQDINLEGMYLSDNLKKPQKYSISSEGSQASTVLPAHGYRIVWCDKQAPKSQLHAPFKLENNDSAYVVLSAADLSWADTLVYCLHNGGESVARFPDGAAQLYRTTRPTPQARNQRTMYSTLWDEPRIDIEDGIGSVHDGELALCYNDGAISLHGTPGCHAALSLYTLGGVQVFRCDVHLPDGRATVPLSLLQRGVYVARMQDDEGNTCSMKLKY